MNHMYKKILLPTDGSEHAARAAEHALWIAHKSNAKLTIISVIESTFIVGLPSADVTDEIRDMLKTEAQKHINKIQKLAEEKGYNVNMELVVKEGSPATTILKYAKEEDIDLIIMGTSGKSGIDRLLMGSVAQNIIKSSKCPVLVVQ